VHYIEYIKGKSVQFLILFIVIGCFVIWIMINELFKSNEPSELRSYNNIKVPEQPVVTQEDIDKNKKENSIEVTYKDLKNYVMQEYSNVSVEIKTRIFNTILEESKKYNINPIWLTAIIHTESSFRFWITHKQIKPKVHGERITTHAIGLGGVVYEIWKEHLHKKDILSNKTDLYEPVTNVKATAYIFNHYLNRKKLPDTESKYESALLRYYGVLFNEQDNLDRTYYYKVSNFIGDLARKNII